MDPSRFPHVNSYFKKTAINTNVCSLACYHMHTLTVSKRARRVQLVKMKLVLASFLLVSLVLSSSFLQSAIAYSPSPSRPPVAPGPAGLCDGKCAERCKAAGYKDRCLKYCGICCKECQCVPSGTHGNKSECPCYRDKLNSKGKPKCP